MPTHLHLAHVTPFAKQPIVFLTVCAEGRQSVLANERVHGVLREIWGESLKRQGWAVGDYVIMPDHVHLFARAAVDGVVLGSWVRAWKSISTKRLRKERGGALLPAARRLWQRDYFDRFLRNTESYADKWDYVRANAVRAGLVARAEEWPYQGTVQDLRW